MRFVTTAAVVGIGAAALMSCGGDDGPRVATNNGVRFEQDGRELTLVIEDDAPTRVRSALQGRRINVGCERSNLSRLASARITFPARGGRAVVRMDRDLSNAFACAIEPLNSSADIAGVLFTKTAPKEVERAVLEAKKRLVDKPTGAKCQPHADETWTCDIRGADGQTVECSGLTYRDGRIVFQDGVCVYPHR